MKNQIENSTDPTWVQAKIQKPLHSFLLYLCVSIDRHFIIVTTI